MNAEIYKEQIKDNVVSVMLDYMSEDEDCGYTKKDVQKCEIVLVEYIDNLSQLDQPTDKSIMQQVKKVVVSLNKLNAKTDYCLIETDARENIWQIIQNSAAECGLKTEEDITEEWREW